MIRVARIMVPVQERQAIVVRHPLDTRLHRAGDLAQIAAHALVLDNLVATRAIGQLDAGNGLVRSVFTGNVAAPATDTGVLVDLAIT